MGWRDSHCSTSCRAALLRASYAMPVYTPRRDSNGVFGERPREAHTCIRERSGVISCGLKGLYKNRHCSTMGGCSLE